MSDQTNPKLYPTVHLPNLFQRTLKSASAKGGLAFGAPSPLLPWLSAPPPVEKNDAQAPSVTAVDKAQRVIPEQAAPLWLQLSFTSADADNAGAGLIFKLRPISHVGFGFGQRCPW